MVAMSTTRPSETAVATVSPTPAAVETALPVSSCRPRSAKPPPSRLLPAPRRGGPPHPGRRGDRAPGKQLPPQLREAPPVQADPGAELEEALDPVEKGHGLFQELRERCDELAGLRLDDGDDRQTEDPERRGQRRDHGRHAPRPRQAPPV